MRGELYQKVLIVLGIVVTALFSAFLYRELFPEYKIYQKGYIELENFRSSYTGDPPPPFKPEVKQLVIERKDKGPPQVERCISCHVALEFEHFSPTKIAYGSDGRPVKGADGLPLKVKNDQYVWGRLDEKIAELNDKERNDKLTAEGKQAEVRSRLSEAKRLESLKTAHVGEHTYDMTKVLAMHPLIGKETRPFEFHPIEEYGCVACHSGNDRGLTTEKAHGPVFDGQYEEEFMGHEPKFLESDPENDPKFSKVFNHKPGHSLLFQTTPLLVGGLIESKCVQCHEPAAVPFSNTSGKPKSPSEKIADIDFLTQHYSRGKELFFSQACYACHRIAGLSRGGVGPELTEEGNKYPWFIKESIVWPQADMKTSTMPNFHLDHEELEALTTYLLAQKGHRKNSSETAHKVAIQEWEAGKKMPWEEPIPPAKMHSLGDAMEIFATEGCAACHRLKGFQSDVGFAVENQKEATLNDLYKEQEWFAALFPEEIPGSQIVSAIEANSKDIDRRIVNGVRNGSILEQISAKYPETIEEFYSNFKYAERAKNHEYDTLAAQATDPEAKAAYEELKEEWRERVHRVLMAYIQEYGLGRLIGPKPSFSGIYRTDEWLMEHFKHPSAHVARSIMPAMPFDTTKFYALTNMLTILGERNREQLRSVWQTRGFNPQQVYETLCAQCHGEFLQGNGPIAEWIYPIPKSLRNADFLHNLTKEKAYQSILHGVKGTPMPPWGEIRNYSEDKEGKPLLTETEAMHLVDWIYSSLPGSRVIRSAQEVPKWQYTPEKFAEELAREGGGANEVRENLAAAYFDINTSSSESGEKEGAFIKKKYYTPENLLAGKALFTIHCADCHGREADGSGIRSVSMFDAKPRMLTNLNWLKSRDDLRLLRSIKYGVPGTAMVAWGDQTNALQRMQLVMFIRSISLESKLRDQLQAALYKTYSDAEHQIEKARISKFSHLATLQKALESSQKAKIELEAQAVQGEAPSDAALEEYQKELKLSQELNAWKKSDQTLLDLKSATRREKELMLEIGLALIAQRNYGITIDPLLALIDQQKRIYSWDTGDLSLKKGDEHSFQMKQLLIEEIDKAIKALSDEKKLEQGKIHSPETKEAIHAIDKKIRTLIELKETILSSLDEAESSRSQQKELIDTFNTQMKALETHDDI